MLQLPILKDPSQNRISVGHVTQRENKVLLQALLHHAQVGTCLEKPFHYSIWILATVHWRELLDSQHTTREVLSISASSSFQLTTKPTWGNELTLHSFRHLCSELCWKTTITTVSSPPPGQGLSNTQNHSGWKTPVRSSRSASAEAQWKFWSSSFFSFLLLSIILHY